MSMNEVINRIDSVISDNSIPRNVKRAAENAKRVLAGPGADMYMKKNESISILSEVSDDPNLPMQGRTKLWGILSALEALDTNNRAMQSTQSGGPLSQMP